MVTPPEGRNNQGVYKILTHLGQGGRVGLGATVDKRGNQARTTVCCLAGTFAEEYNLYGAKRHHEIQEQALVFYIV